MKSTRPSSMPRVFDCPSALLPVAAPVHVPSDESDLGHAAHKALARMVRGEDLDLSEIARDYGVKLEDLEPLIAYGRKAWAEIGRYFPAVATEARLDSDLGPGTADLLSRVLKENADRDEAIVIGDWKSGRVLHNHRRQVQAYAYAARYSFGLPASGKITALVIWLRSARYEVYQFTAEDLDAFRFDYLALESQVDRSFAPGEHCEGCPRQLECPARDAYLRSSQTALIAANQDGITPADMAMLYPRVLMVEKAIKAYRTALHMALANGPLPCGDDKQLELLEQKRAVIDPLAARPVLDAHGFTPEDIARATTIGKGDLEEIVGSRAPQGMKGKSQKALIKALEQSGAITYTSYTKLSQSKIGA